MFKSLKIVLRVGVVSILWPAMYLGNRSSAMAESGKPSLLRESMDDRLDPIQSTPENQPLDVVPVAVPLPAGGELGAVGLLVLAAICWKRPRWLVG